MEFKKQSCSFKQSNFDQKRLCFCTAMGGEINAETDELQLILMSMGGVGGSNRFASLMTSQGHLQNL